MHIKLLLLLSLALLTICDAENPVGHYLLLRGDPKIIRSVIDHTDSKKISPSELEKKIRQIAEGKALKIHAEFSKSEKPGSVTHHQTDKKDISLKIQHHSWAKDQIALGIRALTVSEYQKRDEHYGLSLTSSLEFKGSDWVVFGSWSEPDQGHLLLGRYTYDEAKTPKNQRGRHYLGTTYHLSCLLLETKKEDLDQFKKSTPATREKAVKWLTGRSSMLAEVELRANRHASSSANSRRTQTKNGEALDSYGGHVHLEKIATGKKPDAIALSLNIAWDLERAPKKTGTLELFCNDEYPKEQWSIVAEKKVKNTVIVALVNPKVSPGEISPRDEMKQAFAKVQNAIKPDQQPKYPMPFQVNDQFSEQLKAYREKNPEAEITSFLKNLGADFKHPVVARYFENFDGKAALFILASHSDTRKVGQLLARKGFL